MANTNLHAPTKNIRELLQYGFGVQLSCMAHPQMGNTNLMCPNKAVLANTHFWDIVKARQTISRSLFDAWRSNNVHRNGCAGQYNSVRYTYGAPKLFGNPFLILDASLDGTHQLDVHQNGCIKQYNFFGNA